MKKVLLTIATLGTILFAGCEKDDVLMRSEKSLLPSDQKIMCRGCADWDIVDPESEGASLRSASSTTEMPADTTSIPINPVKPTKPGKRKN